MAGPTRTRFTVEARRQQIVDAMRKVVLARGLRETRVQDVAAQLGISSGLIHYHFATKEELTEAMLRENAADGLANAKKSLASLPSPELRLAKLLDTYYLPSSRRDPWWVLWIDFWGEALRDDALRRISEDLDNAWVELTADVIAEGVAAGTFRSDDPLESAWRLCALLDGLALQVVLHERTMTRAQMRRHGRRAVALELGYDLPE
jgi:AcrR family transcriptional regulator